MNVLIIKNRQEDEADIMNTFRTDLSDLDIKINSSKRYLDIIKKNKVDLIILNLNLDKMNGLHMIEKIRNFSDIPIIAFSDRSNDRSDVEFINALEAGANRCINKPINQRVLAAYVRVLLRKYR